MRKLLLLISVTLFTVNVWGQSLNTPNGNIGSTTNPETGNVGIGTISPSERLEVAGSIALTTNINQSGTANQLDINPYRLLRLGRLSNHEDFGVYFYTGDGSGVVNHLLNGTGNSYLAIDNGNIGIGTTSPTYKLSVKGTIGCGEVKVEDVSGWADFVFEPEYELMSLKELDNFIQENKHLPEIPTTAEVEEDGISVGEMNAKLLQKIEELTLYVIELQKQVEGQDNEIEELKKLIK